MTAEHAAAAGGEVEAAADALMALADVLHAEMHKASPCYLSPAVAHECVYYHRASAVAVHVFTSRWLADDRAATRATAADTVLATARRLCCGDNPAPHHAATDAHSTRMAFAEELARAVRGS